MIKCKLQAKRISRNISQEFMANSLGMDISNYCRRENGQTKISKREWIKISSLLNVQLADIFEDEESQVKITSNDDLNKSNEVKSYSLPYFVLEHTKKYIEKLEEEISILKTMITKE